MNRGQGFAVPFESASATSHSLRFNVRVPVKLRRVCVHDTGRGLMTKFAVAGDNKLLGSFPLAGLDPKGLTDKDNDLGLIVLPEMDIEITATYSAGARFQGWIGCDPVTPEELEAALPALKMGKPVGPPIWAFGIGEATVANGASGATSASYSGGGYLQKQGRLGRMVSVGYGTNVQIGEVRLVDFKIAGDPMYANGGYAMDLAGLSAFNSDEDGLRLNEEVGQRDLLELFWANNNAAPVVVQTGWFSGV